MGLARKRARRRIKVRFAKSDGTCSDKRIRLYSIVSDASWLKDDVHMPYYDGRLYKLFKMHLNHIG